MSEEEQRGGLGKSEERKKVSDEERAVKEIDEERKVLSPRGSKERREKINFCSRCKWESGWLLCKNNLNTNNCSAKQRPFRPVYRKKAEDPKDNAARNATEGDEVG